MKYAIWLLTLAISLVWGLPALAQDYGKKDIVLVLDNSGSMKKHDPDFLLKQAVTQFLDQIVGDTRVSVIIFDQDVRVTVPFTEFSDATEQLFLDSLDGVNYGGLYTNSPMAIERAIYELKSERREDARRVVVFMTDGIVDTGNARKDAESSRWMREELAAAAAAQNIQIFGIAFTESADFQTIQSLALKTDADYFRAYQAEDLSRVFERLKTALFEPLPKPIPEPVRVPVTLVPPVVTPPPSAPLAAATSVPDTASTARPGGQSSSTVSVAPAGSIDGQKGAFEPAHGATQDTASSGTARSTSNKHTAAGQGASKAEPASTASPATAVFDPSRDIAIVAVVGGVGVAGMLLMVLLIMRRRPRGAQSPPAPARPGASLLDLQKVTGEREIRIDNDVVIVGRQAAAHPGVQSLVIPQTTIGRQHAIIEFKRYQYWIMDQNSTNGTFVNDERITAEHAIAHGDKIRFHNCEFNFQLIEMVDTDKTAYASAEEVAELTEINSAVHGIDADKAASDYRQVGAMAPSGPKVASADELHQQPVLPVPATGKTGIEPLDAAPAEESGGQAGKVNVNEQAEPKGQRVAQSQSAFGLAPQDDAPIVDAQSLASWEAEAFDQADVFDQEDVTLVPQSPAPDAVVKSLAVPQDAKATPWTDDLDLPDIDDTGKSDQGAELRGYEPTLTRAPGSEPDRDRDPETTDDARSPESSGAGLGPGSDRARF